MTKRRFAKLAGACSRGKDSKWKNLAIRMRASRWRRKTTTPPCCWTSRCRRWTASSFSKRLRTKKPTMPVIFMTGYPSVPTATSAVRLGASGYIMKPFTPEEITQAMQKFIPRARKRAKAAKPPQADSWTPAAKSEVRFWHEAWYQQGKDDVGPRRRGADAESAERAEKHPPAEDRRSGLPGPADGLDRDGRQYDDRRARPGFRRRRGGQRIAGRAIFRRWFTSLARADGSPASARRGWKKNRPPASRAASSC